MNKELTIQIKYDGSNDKLQAYRIKPKTITEHTIIEKESVTSKGFDELKEKILEIIK